MPPTVRQPLADDTPLEIEERQLEGWRRMTPQDKMRLVAGVSRAVNDAAREGLRRRHPGASERELFLRLAILRLGDALAVEAFPEAAALAAERNRSR